MFIFELNYFDYYFIWGFSYPFVCYENCVFAGTTFINDIYFNAMIFPAKLKMNNISEHHKVKSCLHLLTNFTFC